MNYLNLFLELLTFFAFISALAVITSTNPVLAIVFLIILFLNVGIYLILMGLQFIGLSYLLVYVGAITVLFLFIIMMLSVDISSSVEVGINYSKLLPLAYSIAILFLILFLITIPSFLIDFTSGALTREIYSAINGLIFNNTPVGTINFSNSNGFFVELFNWLLDWFNYLYTNIFGASEPSLHSLTNTDSFLAANIGHFNWNYLLNHSHFVELNENFNVNSFGAGLVSPNGFYYFHPLVHSELAQGINSFQSVVQNSTGSSPYLFPLGWYSDDPYSLFTQWVSNKNINLFLWYKTSPAYFGYFDPTISNWAPGFELQPWINILFANTATNVNYAGAAYSQWYTSSSVDLVDIGINVHPYRQFMLPITSLHNYFLGLTWLGVPNLPEFLVEFPQSPVLSPLYFENDSGVHHFIETYNATNENVSLINLSTFGDPSTLLHKNLQIQTIGQTLYGNYSILLILSSFLLLLAMVCPIVLARNSHNSSS